MKRDVSLFRNGRNQAVRIPREFELPGDRATMTRQGDRLIIEPIAKRSIFDVLAGLPPLPDEEDGLDSIDDPPPEPVEL